MPARLIIAEELSKLLSIVAHPRRIRVIEELGSSEMDVQTLVGKLKIPQTSVSQALAHLRSQGLVSSRREGKHIFYRLRHPWIAEWLLQGLDFLEQSGKTSMDVMKAAKKVRLLWAQTQEK